MDETLKYNRYLEKIKFDLIEFKEEENFTMVTVNYFTKKMWDWPLRSKSAQGVVEFIKDLFRQKDPRQ